MHVELEECSLRADLNLECSGLFSFKQVCNIFIKYYLDHISKLIVYMITILQKSMNLASRRDQTPPWVSYLCLYCEMLTILLALNINSSNKLLFQSFTFDLTYRTGTNYFILILASLIIIISTQMWCQICLIRMFYAALFQVALNMSTTQFVILLCLILVSLQLEILANCSDIFYDTISIYKQFNHQIKYLHYSILLMTIFIANNRQSAWGCIALAAVYLIILIIRIRYPITNCFTNSIFQYFYLLCSLSALWNLAQQFLKLSTQMYFGTITAFFILLLLIITKYKTKTGFDVIKLSDFGNVTPQIRKILTYIYSSQFDQTTDQTLLSFLKLNQQELNLSTRYTRTLNLINKQPYAKSLAYFLANQHIEQFQDKLFLAQVEFKINSNIPKSLTLLRELEQQLSKYSFLKKIQIRRIKEDIFREFQSCSKKSIFDDIKANSEFIEQLHLAALDYKELWTVMAEYQVVIENVQAAIKKVINNHKQLKFQYQQLFEKDRHTVRLYCYYLYEVERNLFDSLEIYDDYTIFVQKSPLKLEDKIFIKFSMEREDVGLIEYISHNSNSLLGYTTQYLLERSINQFVPEVYRSKHQGHLVEYVNNETCMKVDYRAQSFCLHHQGSYRFIDLHFRITYDLVEDSLHGIGYMTVNKNQNGIVIVDRRTGDLVNEFENTESLIDPALIDDIVDNKTISLNFPAQKIHTFQLFKTMITQNNSLLVLKNTLQPVQWQPTHKITIKNYQLSPDSSIISFIAQRQQFLQDFNKVYIAVRMIAISLFSAGAFFCVAYNMYYEHLRTDWKYSITALTYSLQLKQINTLQMYIKMHEMYLQNVYNISYPDVDYLTQLSTILKTVEYYNSNLSMFSSTLTTQTVNLQNYTVTIYEVLQSMATSIAFASINSKSNDAIINSLVMDQFKYTLKNEAAATQGLATEKSNILKYAVLQVAAFKNIYYTLCICGPITVFLLCVALLALQIENRLKNKRLIELLLSIKNQDKTNFIQSINLYLEKITGKSDFIKYSNQKVQNLHDKNSSLTTRNLTSSHEFTIQRGFQSNQQLSRSPKDDHKMTRSKQITIWYLVKVFIVVVPVSILFPLSFIHSSQDAYVLPTYFNFCINFQLKSSFYFQKIQYFLKAAENNFTNLTMLQSIFTKQHAAQVNTTNLRVTLLQFAQFAVFNSQFNNIMFQPVATYCNNCDNYKALLNSTLDDLYLQHGQYLLSTATNNYNSTNMSVITTQTINFIIYTADLFGNIMLNAINSFYSNLNVHTSIQNSEQMTYYYLIITTITIYWLCFVVPYCYNLIIKNKLHQQILSLIDENIYN